MDPPKQSQAFYLELLTTTESSTMIGRPLLVLKVDGSHLGIPFQPIYWASVVVSFDRGSKEEKTL